MRFSSGKIAMVLRAVFWTAFVAVLAPHLSPIDAPPGPSLEALASITGHAESAAQQAPDHGYGRAQQN